MRGGSLPGWRNVVADEHRCCYAIRRDDGRQSISKNDLCPEQRDITLPTIALGKSSRQARILAPLAGHLVPHRLRRPPLLKYGRVHRDAQTGAPRLSS